MRAACVVVIVGWLTGCATLQEPTVVSVPVHAPCVKLDGIPAWPALFADAAWAVQPPDPFKRLMALKADRVTLLEHASRLDSLLRLCAAP